MSDCGHTPLFSEDHARGGVERMPCYFCELAALRTERDALIVRRDELLKAMVRVTRETPYPEEAGNAAVLIAEVGTLKARVAELEQEAELGVRVDADNHQRWLDACAEADRLRVDVANYAAICSKVNDAIGRAGIHCALDFWEAIDRIAKERDEAQRAVRDGFPATVAVIREQRDVLQARVAELESAHHSTWKARHDVLWGALEKISAIRDSIVGMQGFNFSEHAYPLVAALKLAGFDGVGHTIASKNLGTLIDQRDAAEAERDAYRAMVADLLAGAADSGLLPLVVRERARELLKNGPKAKGATK